MTGVLDGFATIAAVIALGALLAHIGMLDEAAQRLLSRLAFFVASPALLVETLSRTDVAAVLSGNLAATVAGVVVAGGTYAVLARTVWHRSLGEGVIGTLCSAYVNAGNLGIPVAAYVLGDAAFVAPTLLLQLIVLQPLALALLDLDARGAPPSWRQLVGGIVRNPLTVGSVVGLVLALTGWSLPTALRDPLALVGNMAVPSMLLAYGIALQLGPGLGVAGSAAELATTTVLKLLVQPLTAWAVAALLLGTSGHALLAIVVTSALPTAQNIFVHATRYQRHEVLARDAILITTVGAVPVILVIVLALG